MLLFSAGNDKNETLLRESWQHYFEKGKLQYKAEMYDYCLENMDNALRINPKLYEAANTIAIIQDMRGKKDEALEYFNRSLNINLQQAEIHFRTGILQEYFAAQDRAFAHFLEAVRIDPQHARAHAALIRHYLRKNEKARADEHFRQSNAAAEKEVSPLYLKAGQYRDKKMTDQAAQVYDEIMETGPASMDAYLQLYEIYRRRGLYDRAAKTLERLLYIRPDHGRAHLYLANIYFTITLPGHSRKYYLEKSITHVQKALEQDPRDAEAVHLLAEIYKYMGKDVEAEKARTRAHELETEQQ